MWLTSLNVTQLEHEKYEKDVRELEHNIPGLHRWKTHERWMAESRVFVPAVFHTCAEVYI